ncbi:aspartate aminotransferase family protein [Solitalea longa]|uniref:Aspartate aminotransferase family protein n=1 Tax=Solitalea longa TaxID=2079460 RepID=A0A2S5A6Z0_9SPHI|nr:aspartate aminotransferase family protein [Solitalea longa]POY38348.1 aspartate aminotransferase family protein [Solitalea longa]
MIPLRQLFLQHNAQTTDFPLMLEFTRGEGIYLFDKNNKPHIDLISGIGVSNIGHCHPKVVNAIKTQAETYMHQMVYGEFIQAPQTEFAKKLAAHLPEQLQSVYFVNSGAEATEGALKLAKRFTGRTEIIACKNSYHGSTNGALSVMGNEDYKYAFRPLLPDIRFINFNHLPDLELITTKTACVILETIQGEAGIRVPSLEYMQALRKRCTETGTLLILDEIQAGMGRTGKLFAFEHFGVIPDVLLLAKALGAGMPIGAFISSNEIMASLRNDPILGHVTTFGGHPVCCAAGLAGFEALLESNLIEQVEAKHQLFKELLNHLAILDFRGKGLMFTIEFESFELNKKIIDRCIENGVITDWFLHCSNSLRIAPPLIITEDQIREACAIILQSINEIM